MKSPRILFGHVGFCDHYWGQEFFRAPLHSPPFFRLSIILRGGRMPSAPAVFQFNQIIPGWQFVFTNTGLGFYHFPGLGSKKGFCESSNE
jgi:hypothetical protein